MNDDDGDDDDDEQTRGLCCQRRHANSIMTLCSLFVQCIYCAVSSLKKTLFACHCGLGVSDVCCKLLTVHADFQREMVVLQVLLLFITTSW